MKVEDFINVNGLGKFQKSDDGTFMTFEPSNFVVCGHKVDKLKIKYNRDACLMHVYLMGTALMKLGEELNKGSFNVCEMGFVSVSTMTYCVVQINCLPLSRFL